MQPVDSSAGAVRSSFVQGRGTTQYLGSPSLPPPPVSPLVTSDVLAEKSAMHHPCLRITHCMDTIYAMRQSHSLCNILYYFALSVWGRGVGEQLYRTGLAAAVAYCTLDNYTGLGTRQTCKDGDNYTERVS